MVGTCKLIEEINKMAMIKQSSVLSVNISKTDL